MRLLLPTAGNRTVLLRAFREQPDVASVVTTEIDPLAPGIHAADRCYGVPRSDAPGYLDAIEHVCRKERIDWILPLADLDLVRFAGERARFEALGTGVWTAPDETLALAMDKARTAALFDELGIPQPRTVALDVPTARLPAFPLYLKPRHVSMKNSPRYFFRQVGSPEELETLRVALRGQERDYLLQESLAEGREINVDFFVDGGALKRLVTLYRLKAGDGGGIIRGQTIAPDPRIREMVETLVARVGFRGATNIQVYAMPDGGLRAVEINPRFSNSSALVTRPAGVDFFALTLRMMRGESIEADFGDYALLRVTSAYEPLIVEEPVFAEELGGPRPAG